MSEAGVIARSARPVTQTQLAADLRDLGLGAGDVVLAHVSLSALGYVPGGAVAVLQALGNVLGDSGTLVMPTQSGDLSDPAHWVAPPVPAEWQDAVRDAIPAYDPVRTPTRGLGRVAELFRTWPEVIRSAHPTCSFAARGPEAAAILADHRLDDPFGEGTPLARMAALETKILLLGAPWDSCTAFHLAERRAAPGVEPEIQGSPILRDGERVWVRWLDYPSRTEDYPALGARLETAGLVRMGRVGEESARLAAMPALIEAAIAALRDPGWPAG
jgi:aminoglycoside 3-N-acetyltransferase